MWGLGAVLIDENLSREGAPMAIGFFEASAVLGPAVGFLLGGGFLNFWVDGNEKAPQDLTPDDQLWLGNWWLGFDFFLVFSYLTSNFSASS